MTILSLRNSVNHAPLRRGVLLIALTLASFALSSTARAQLLTSEMAGGGSVFQGTVRITHGFEVHCGTDANPSSIGNNLDINWGPDKKRHHFQLDPVLISSDCFYDPSVGSPNPPPAGFNTMIGDGTGFLDNVRAAGTIHFTFTDAGEPGGTNGTPPPDTAAFLIIDGSGTVVLSVPATALTFGNHQALAQWDLSRGSNRGTRYENGAAPGGAVPFIFYLFDVPASWCVG